MHQGAWATGSPQILSFSEPRPQRNSFVFPQILTCHGRWEFSTQAACVRPLAGKGTQALPDSHVILSTGSPTAASTAPETQTPGCPPGLRSQALTRHTRPRPRPLAPTGSFAGPGLCAKPKQDGLFTPSPGQGDVRART